MVLSQSELLRYKQEQATKFVARNKCVDASLRTVIVQATASSVPTPRIVASNSTETACAGKVTISGKGTNGEYIGVLQSKQAAALNAPCSINKPSDTGVNPQIVLPVPCINYNAPPFTQQNLSTMYVEPCKVPGKVDYFPPFISNGPNCTLNLNRTPSG